MTVEERRRMALHSAAADTWGEEVADTLVELVAPSGHELATREDVRAILEAMDAMERRWDERFAAQDERWDGRLAAQDGRLAAQEEKLDLKFAAQDERWDARLAAQVERWDARLAAHDAKWDRRHAEMLAQLAQLEQFEERSQARFHEAVAIFERRIADAVTHQTRTLVFSQLAAIVVIAGLAFGLR